jgi:RNA polymerase sigma factor (sigma-70 family)
MNQATTNSQVLTVDRGDGVRTEDGSIIQQCIDGNAAAFGFLVDKYKKSVYALAYSEIRNFHDAQDVTQEVFIKAYRKLHTLRRWDNFMGWLYRITSNLCKDWLRSRAKRPDREFVEDQEPGILDHPSIESYRESMVYESIREALDSLPEMYRQVLTLRYFGGMNIREMSRFLGVSPRTIDRRLRIARAQLREGILAMMSTTYEQHKLPASLTFRIVEIVKRIKIHPMPRTAGLPWGLSLATGIIFTVVSLSPHLSILNRMSSPGGSPIPIEANVLKTSQMPAIASNDRGNDNQSPDPSDLQSVFLLTSQAEADIGTTKADVPMSEPHISTDAMELQSIAIDLPGLAGDAKKLEMVLIQPGTFTMGSPKGERGRSDKEWPPHKVTITRPFYIGKYEVTQAQWELVMRSNRSKFRGNPNYPVEKVSWGACQKFIKRLNALGQGTFRLPTEAEWEYACRAGTETPFSFGNAAGVAQREDYRQIADRYMWWQGNNEPNSTKEVGLKLPNSWGLHDMHGNVHEWCSDRWEPPHEREPQIDPQGPSSGARVLIFWTNRVFRGGCYSSGAEACRSAYRNYEQSFDYHYALGLRLVREYP